MSMIQKAVRIASGSAAVQGINLLLATLSSVVLTRVLGVEGFGIYSFAYSFALILCVPVQAGLPTLITRETARYQQALRLNAINAILKWSALVVLVLSVTVILLSVPLILFLFNSYAYATLVSLVLIPVVGLSTIRSAVLKGLGRVLVGQIPDLILRPLLLIVFVLLTFQFHSVSPELSLLLHGLAAFFAFLVGAIVLVRVAPAAVLRGVPDYSDKPEWKRSVYSISLVSGVQVLNANAGVLVLGAFGTPDEVGVFKVAFTCALLLMFGRTAVLAVIQPYLARYFYGNQLQKLRFVVASVSAFSFSVMVPALLAVYYWGDSIVSAIFGSEYIAATVLILVLSVGQMVNSYFASVGSLLMMSGNERRVVVALVFTTVLFIPILILAARTNGAVGVATVISAQIAVLHVIYWLVALRKTHIDCGAHALIVILAKRYKASI